MISVTKVQLSKDIKTAKIYLSIYNSEDNFNDIDVFNKIVYNKSAIKYKMGLQLKSKYVPDIEFIKDDSMKNYDNINKIIKGNE